MNSAAVDLGASTIGPFILEELIGEGGMAQIWRASQTFPDASHRYVALKVLRPIHSSDPHFRRMFQDEIDIATTLEHGNVVRVYGACHEDPFFAQVLEHIDGRDLLGIVTSAQLAKEPFPVQFALRIGCDVARALAYIHTKEGSDGQSLDIVHRDISPSNIMVDPNGTVKVLDFGIARAKSRLAKTQHGTFKGKYGYMAPEQALSVGTSVQTDIFALGVVIWELLSGKRLFDAPDPRTMMTQLMNLEVPPLRDSVTGVPVEADLLVRRMLQQRAVDRPDSALEVHESLTQILSSSFKPEVRAKEAFSTWVSPFLVEDDKRPTVSVLHGRDTDEVVPLAPFPVVFDVPISSSEDDTREGNTTKRLRRVSPGPRIALNVGIDPVPTENVSAHCTTAPTEAISIQSIKIEAIPFQSIKIEERESKRSRPALNAASVSVATALLLAVFALIMTLAVD